MAGTLPRVLLVDDDAAFGLAMAKALRRRGFSVQVADRGAAAVEILRAPDEADAPQVVVLDLRMPEMDGLEVLRRTAGRRMPVVVLTGHGSVPEAVECMRLGAYTFLTKPVDAADLAPVLRQAAQPTEATVALVGNSAETVHLRALLGRLADADEPVLLSGEPGTGKEAVASTLHHLSHRAAEPFVAVNMACMPHDLVGAELFGHLRGAWTGADRNSQGLLGEAGGGTLFLDEIAQLPLAHQAKLLRAIETRSYRVAGDSQSRPFQARLVVATHQPLLALVQAGAFLEDLYYRLQVLPLQLKPLRARRDDILPIAQHWLHRVGGAHLRFTDTAQARLLAHPWPGNVREVVNLSRRVALFAEGDVVDQALVERMLVANPFGTSPQILQVPATEEVEEISLEALERRHIQQLLSRHHNITRVAKILEINRRTLQRKLRAWGIDPEALPSEP